MNWKKWNAHFEANRSRPLPDVTPPSLSAEAQAALVHSLKIFQIGETGEGRIVDQIRRVKLKGIDADYHAALKAFIQEEGRHAGILARAVLALDGQLLKHSWAALAFAQVRHCAGVRFKLLVLLVAEVIGIAFYGLLSDALPSSGLKTALRQLCQDEEAHLKFHCEFFASRAHSPVTRGLLKSAFWCVAFAAALAVLWDHRRALRVFEIGTLTAAQKMLDRVRESTARMSQPALAAAYSAPPSIQL